MSAAADPTADEQVDTEVFRSSLAVELPAGWSAGESVTFTSPNGIDVNVTAGRASGATAESLATELLPDSTAVASIGSHGGIGSPDFSHQRRRSDGGEPSTWSRVAVALDGDRAVVCRATWPATSPEGDGDFDLVVAHIRDLRPAASAQVETPGSTPAPPGSSFGVAAEPVEPTVLSGSDWAGLQAAWSDTSAEPPAPEGEWVLSAEELAVLGLVAGAMNVPTVEPYLLEQLADDEMAIAMATVLSSLRARGWVRSSASGLQQIDDTLATAIDALVAPSLVLTVAELSAEGETSTWYGVRPGAAVRIRSEVGSARRLTLIDPATVMATIASPIAGAAAAEPESQRAVAQTLIEGGALVVQVSAIWHDDRGTEGDAALWVRTADGTTASVTMAEPGTVEMAGASGERLVGALLELLPRGAPREGTG